VVVAAHRDAAGGDEEVGGGRRGHPAAPGGTVRHNGWWVKPDTGPPAGLPWPPAASPEDSIGHGVSLTPGVPPRALEEALADCRASAHRGRAPGPASALRSRREPGPLARATHTAAQAPPVRSGGRRAVLG
jgi:hypothetical protein